MTKIKISDLTIEIIKKDIKNIHLGVYPPKSRIRMAIPLKTSNESAKLFVISKMPWIKKQQKIFSNYHRQTPREYVTGETHYIFGKAYLLDVISSDGPVKIETNKKTHIKLYVKPKTTIKQKEKIFENYYRLELNNVILKNIKKWEEKVSVKVKEIKIKKMKTKWGVCNNKEKRIWLNLELAKKPFYCIDYVLVHELVHLKETKHNDRFLELLESAYPKWLQHKEELNNGILGHFEWGCKPNSKLKNIIQSRF